MISGVAVAVTPYVVGTLLGAGGVVIVENQVSSVELLDLLFDVVYFVSSNCIAQEKIKETVDSSAALLASSINGESESS